MRLTANGSNRRPGSNVVAFLVGLLLIVFSASTFYMQATPFDGMRAYVISGTSALIFGLVLLVWVWSDWKHYIGNETVNMVVGIVAALIAIIAFANDIEKQPDSQTAKPSVSTNLN